ncbi:acyl-CoA dehydrogenase family protein [uncultured Sphingomonas sp.]|uniref:acyl-CoA dehydrogenase family protein n=1 Tax=uncultured Sphingomonas sp. TaxID=158754 RepID=UPI0035C9B51A
MTIADTPAEYDAYRARARTFLEAQVAEFGMEARAHLGAEETVALARRYQAAKFANGFAGINLPTQYGGQGLSQIYKIIFDQEEMPYGFPTEFFSISLGMPLPIMLRRAPEEQRQRFAVPALKGENIWCQLFSEPAAGSDLAALRTRAERDGDDWVINGQKLWTSYAQYADYGVIVVRTDGSVAKHKGLTYFWLDMKAPGITVRPIKLMTGDSHVNEVFFDNVRIPDSQRLGAVGEGFAVAMETLFIERYAAADEAGFGPPAAYFAAFARDLQTEDGPAIKDGRIRREIASAYRQQSALAAIRDTAFLALTQGKEPDANGSIHKLVSMRSRQRLSAIALDMVGPSAIAIDHTSRNRRNWTTSWMSGPLGRIAGGADEMLLNTIAERVLGLPQDYRPDKNMPFNQAAA